MIREKTWAEISPWLDKAKLDDIFYPLFDYITENLKNRFENIKVTEGRMISFFSGKREFLIINITRKDVRIYVHPPTGAYFNTDDKFKVEKSVSGMVLIIKPIPMSEA